MQKLCMIYSWSFQFSSPFTTLHCFRFFHALKISLTLFIMLLWLVRMNMQYPSYESEFMAHGKAISLLDDVYEFIQLFRQEQYRVIGWNSLCTHDYHPKRHNNIALFSRFGNFHAEIESSIQKQQTLLSKRKFRYLGRCPWREIREMTTTALPTLLFSFSGLPGLNI